jgi:hypothetical protein
MKLLLKIARITFIIIVGFVEGIITLIAVLLGVLSIILVIGVVIGLCLIPLLPFLLN